MQILGLVLMTNFFGPLVKSWLVICTILGIRKVSFFYYSYNAGNAHINSGWRGLYAVVNQSNSVINDVPVFAKGNVSDAVITRAVAEARFVRAMAYYMLSEFFGEVPIIENPLEIILSGNTKLPKNTRNSVYEFIRRDLEFAAANLPNSDQPGRATSWTAKGLLSKVYLTMAQYNLFQMPQHQQIILQRLNHYLKMSSRIAG
jgi:hypothetical protein